MHGGSEQKNAKNAKKMEEVSEDEENGLSALRRERDSGKGARLRAWETPSSGISNRFK